MRVYDPANGSWRVTWFSPVRGAELQLLARSEADAIVLDSVERDPLMFRWIISDIADDSFIWRGSGSEDQGVTWLLLQEMGARRRS